MKSLHNQALTANTVKTITLDQASASFVMLSVTTGTGPVFWTFDGSDPTVNGANTCMCNLNRLEWSEKVGPCDAQTIKVITAATGVVVSAFASL